MDKNKIRYIIGIICIIGSFGGMSTGQPLPSIFMLLFGISLLPIIYEKVDVSRIKNAEIVIPIVVFVLFVIVIASVGNTTSQNDIDNNEIVENNVMNDKNEENKSEEEDKTNTIVETKSIMDVPSFTNITYDLLVEKMGQPTSNDTYTVNGKTAQIYSYDKRYEFMLYNNKLIRITIYASEIEELKNLKKIDDFCKKLNITDYSTSNKSADTGYALRYNNLTEAINDFWITSLDDSDYIEIKITFDTNGFNI